MKTTRYEQDFHSFVTFYTNVVSAKNAFECFCLLNNISKDAEFQALSEYIIISVITCVYSHSQFEKENKKYRSDEFGGYSTFSMLGFFCIK